MSDTARNSQTRILLVLGLAAMLVMMVVMMFIVPDAYAAKADKVGDNAKDLIMGWLEPLFYVLMGVGALLLFAKRQFPQLLGFLAVGALVAGIIFNPEGTKDILLGISNALTGDKQ